MIHISFLGVTPVFNTSCVCNALNESDIISHQDDMNHTDLDMKAFHMYDTVGSVWYVACVRIL